MADEIRVDIVSGYDDRDAKQALTDAEKLEQADPEIEVTADTSSAVRDLEDVRDTAADIPDVEVSANVDRVLAGFDEVIAETREVQAAADALGAALGPELAAKADTTALVQHLTDAGLTLDDIKGNADQLAVKLEELSNLDVGGKLGGSLGTARGQLEAMEGAGTRARGALANMVGDSVQGLGALGGIAGGAGVAIGQLGEAAAEGELSLSDLGKVAGPMVALAAGTLLLSKAIDAAGSEAREAKRETELWVKVLDQLAQGKVTEAAKTLREEWADTIPILHSLGLTEQDLVDILYGQTSALDGLKQRRAENAAQLDHAENLTRAQADALRAEQVQLDAVIENLDESVAARGNAETSAADQEAQEVALTHAIQANEQAVKAQARESNEATRIMDGYADMAHNAADEIAAADEVTRKYTERVDTLTGKLDDKQAWLSLHDSIDQFKWDMATGELSAREQEQALIDLQQELADYVIGLEGIPEEQKTTLLTLIDKGQFDLVESRLEWLTRDRTININGIVTGSDLRNALEGRGVSGTAAGTRAVPEIGVVNMHLPAGWRGDPIRTVHSARRRTGRLFSR